MSKKIDRRGFLRGTLVSGVAATGFVSLEEKTLMEAMAKGTTVRPKRLSLPGPMPMGKLGNHMVSRIVSGSNLIGGWAHARDLLYVSKLMQAYNTEEKRFETFSLLEEGGVNTVQVDMTQIEQVKKYNQDKGGNLQLITSVKPLWGLYNQPAWDELKGHIDRVIDQGVIAIYIHGGYSDALVKAATVTGTHPENIEYLGRMIEYIREKGYPAGIGCHAIEVTQACDKAGIQPDFYFKTHHMDAYWSAQPKEHRQPFAVDMERSTDHNSTHDNIYDLFPEVTVEYMKSKKQPWFAFKCLAAGAIPPKEGLEYVFKNGADFVVLGMFDFHIQEDLAAAIETINGLEGRERPWCA